MIRRRSLLLAGVALPVAAHAQCVTSAPAVDACLGGVRITAAAPSLDLSFMTPGTLPSGITFTRASAATYFDATGTLQTAAANAPRWDYDPVTHQLLGLLVEGARTNWLLNSAVLGTQNVTVSAQPYTLSFYGTGSVVLSGVATGTLAGTGPFPTRVVLSFTPTAGTLTLTVTGSVLNAQLENAVNASSWMPTTGTSLARALDSATLPTGAWFNAAQSSIVGDYLVAQSVNPLQPAVVRDPCAISDGTFNNRLELRGQSGSSGGSVSVVGAAVAGALTASPGLGNVVGGVPAKLGGSWDGTTGIGALNGAAAVSYSSVGMPAGLNLVTFGNVVSGTNSQLYGWVRRFRYWPRALSASELQAVTT